MRAEADCPAPTGWRLARTCSASALTGCMIGFRSENMREAQPVGMQRAQRLGALLAVAIARTTGAASVPVEAVVDLRDAAPPWRSAARPRRVAAERPDVVERARLAAVNRYLPSISSGFVGVLVDLGDHRLVEAGRQQVDHVHAAGELAVLLGRHLAGDEDAEMADRLVQRSRRWSGPAATISSSWS